MNDKEHIEQIHTSIIHPVFYESSTGRPFTKCIDCGRNVLDKSVNYMIEKAVKQYKDYSATDTIFEYALCMDCYEEMARRMSDLSKKRIAEYYKAHVDFEQRRRKLTEKKESEPEKWLTECLIKGTKRENISEYQIISQCQGNQIIYFNLPILIGNKAMDEMVQLLSDQTLGEMGKFKDRFLGIPPEFKDLFDTRKVLVL